MNVSGGSFLGGELTKAGARVAILETERGSPHLETGIEIAFQLAAEGKAVEYFFFDHLPWPGKSSWSSFAERANPPRKKKWPWISVEKAARVHWHLSQASRYARAARLNVAFDICESAPSDFEPPGRPCFQNLDDLKSYRTDGFAVGAYIASSLVTHSKNSRVIPEDEGDFIDLLWSVFWSSYRKAKEIFSTAQFDSVVLFNGRFAESGGILLAAVESNLQAFFHERGGFRVSKYFLQPWRPHNLKARGQLARLEWEKGDSFSLAEKKHSVQNVLLAARREGGMGLVSFHSPSPPPPRRMDRVVTFFTSSEDEFFSIPDAEPNVYFESQFEAIVSLSQLCLARDWDFFVRIHPHLRNKSRPERDFWDKRLADFLPTGRVLASDSGVNSYELIQETDLVAVWQSTIGLEALAMGKPVITCAETFFKWAGADVFEAKAESLSDICVQAVSHAPDISSVLPALFDLNFGGFDFRFVRPGMESFLGKRIPIVWGLERRSRNLIRKLKPLNRIRRVEEIRFARENRQRVCTPLPPQ